MEEIGLFFQRSMEAAMPLMSCARTLTEGHKVSGNDSCAVLIVSRRKKEIAALDMGFF